MMMIMMMTEQLADVEVEHLLGEDFSSGDFSAHYYCPRCQPDEVLATETCVAFCGYARPPHPPAEGGPGTTCVPCQEAVPIGTIKICTLCGAMGIRMRP